MNRIYHLWVVLSLTFSISGFAQFTGDHISSDGKFVADAYNPFNVDQRLESKGIFVVRSTADNWQRTISYNGRANVLCWFSKNSNQIIIHTPGEDSLYVLGLGTQQSFSLGDVGSFKYYDDGDQIVWIACLLKKDRKLLLKNLVTGVTKTYEDVLDFAFHNGEGLFFITQRSSLQRFNYFNLATGRDICFLADSSNSVKSYVIDGDRGQIAFIRGDVPIPKEFSIWYYKAGENAAYEILNNKHASFPGLAIASKQLSFSQKGSRIYFTLKEKELPKVIDSLTKVDVWSYLDVVSQPQQLIDMNSWLSYTNGEEFQKKMSVDPKREYAAVLTISNRFVVRLENERESITRTIDNGRKLYGVKSESYALVTRYKGDVITSDRRRPLTYLEAEYNWNRGLQKEMLLVSQEDGSIRNLTSITGSFAVDDRYYDFGPEGRFLLYLDINKNAYFSYDIENEHLNKITDSADVTWVKEDQHDMIRDYYKRNEGVLQWGDNNKVWVYDHYMDIWEIDLTGKRKAVCITNGFARKKSGTLKFRPIRRNFFYNLTPDKIVHDKYVILVGEDLDSKQQGLFLVSLTTIQDPLLLCMGPFDYSAYSCKMIESARSFVFERSSVNEPRTFYYTKDFKQIEKICNVQREHFAGLRKEIIKWKKPDGDYGFGILYKPFNFDSTKKYPVIFSYYEGISGYNSFSLFDKFGTSDNQGGALYFPSIISYLISNGYLFFNPEIMSSIGDPGKGATDCINSAAKYLSTLPYIDSKKLGLSGHSYGGYETNFIVTRTNLFAAAFSGSGVTNYFSYYGTEELDAEGYSYIAGSETGQNRLGVTPWDRPDIYIRNSPIFYADHITTPLLMMANRKDHRVPHSQSIELFLALRRLGKPAWLLQYDDGWHSATGDKDSKDIGIRMMQFFDHYLKGAPAPVWMTRGIPARLKGTTLGLEYDTLISTPGPGLLMENEGTLTPQQKELLKYKTRVTDDGRIEDVIDSKKIKKKK